MYHFNTLEVEVPLTVTDKDSDGEVDILITMQLDLRDGSWEVLGTKHTDMRDVPHDKIELMLSEDFIDAYIEENWNYVVQCAGEELEAEHEPNFLRRCVQRIPKNPYD